jgi:pSer/pThr/pTyr-binding forkhead associated (FHA) protein
MGGMDDFEGDVPEHVDIEQDPTISWEPEGADSTREDSSGKLTGAFAWALTIEDGPQSGLTYVLGPGNTVAGRGADTAIFLPDVTVSREHVRLAVDNSGLSMTDLGSTNGTYVNGQRLAAGMLKEGDQVMIGKYHLRVSRGNG